jgi:hypothetical protein
MTDCDRRRAVLGMGAACMMSGTHRAAADGDLAARLADMQRDGRVHGLHTLLVSRDNRVLFEHYGTGDDENRASRWASSPLGRPCCMTCGQ